MWKEKGIPTRLWTLSNLLSGNGEQWINTWYNKIFMVDPIADMINRIKNAQAVKKETVEIPFSKICYEIGKTLERTGFLKKVELRNKKSRGFIDLTLHYKDGKPAVSGVKRVSKQGKRMYAGVPELARVARKRSIVIVSTSKGLMTAGEARSQGVGGELLCEIWA